MAYTYSLMWGKRRDGKKGFNNRVQGGDHYKTKVTTTRAAKTSAKRLMKNNDHMNPHKVQLVIRHPGPIAGKRPVRRLTTTWENLTTESATKLLGR